MQQANCTLITDDRGSTVRKKNVTPAELQLLIHSHEDEAKRFPVLNLDILPEPAVAVLMETGEPELEDGEPVPRTQVQERARLAGIYTSHMPGPKKASAVDKMWPGVNARLPEKFSEVVGKNGKPCFTEDGKILAVAVVEPELIVIEGKTYTKAQLATLLKPKTTPKLTPVAKED